MKRNIKRMGSRRNESARMTAYFRGRLLERRRQALQRLRRDLESLDQTPGGASGDLADMAASSADRETLYGTSVADSDALSRIDHALERIDEGTYGLCEECGARIPRARLRVLPFASLCVSCQQREEREGEGGEADARTWNAADEYELGGLEEVSGLRGSRPGR